MEEQYQETVDANADAGVSNREDTQVSGGGQQRTWDESEIRAVIASPSALVAILRDAVAKRCAFNSTGADKKLSSSLSQLKLFHIRHTSSPVPFTRGFCPFVCGLGP